MSGIQTKNGKAFECACLQALYSSLSASQDVTIKTTPQLETASSFFPGASVGLRAKLIKAASAAARVVIRLEPQLE